MQGSSKFSAPISWDSVSFDFHLPSEHTIDGKQLDLEMVITSTPSFGGPDSPFKESSISILFSVDESTSDLTTLETKVLDSFYESLQLGYVRGNLRIDQIPFGELMEVVDTETRWIYEGSKTIPPCTQKVYQNVLGTVYPIS